MKKILNMVVVMLVVVLIVGIVFSLYKMIPGGGVVDTPIDPDTGTNGVDVEEIILNMKNFIF